MKKFPVNFLWGAATSSYQVEGDNALADWWSWEKKIGHQPSGNACRHYDLYQADFDLIKALNQNAHRLSIEWSRIEPKEGHFDQKEIAHYLDVIRALKSRGIEPMVTLHHFTNPQWLADKGGWENKEVVHYFRRYAKLMGQTLAPYVNLWNTINEPTIFISHAYLFGWWPPQKKSLWAMKKVHDNMVKAHVAAYHAIKAIYKENVKPSPMISIAHHMSDFITCHDTPLNRWAIELRYKWLNFEFLHAIQKQGTLDFIGFNYYSRQIVDVKGLGLHNLLGDVCKDGHLPVKKNFLGWDIYPQGIYNILMRLKKFGVPIYITENGICTNNDDERWDFIREHLLMVHKAIEDGVDVRGYMHWSLLDNFEWDKGYGPRFGLVHVDFQTQVRTVKESARKYAQICKSGEIS